jgi:hypothetical protein
MKGKKKRTLVILTMFPFSFVLDVKYAVYILQYYLAFQSLDFECFTILLHLTFGMIRGMAFGVRGHKRGMTFGVRGLKRGELLYQLWKILK